MSLSVAETALSIDYVGEKTRSVCKTLTNNPGAGAVVFLFPQDEKRAAFQFIRVTYPPRLQRIKFCIGEHRYFPPTLIGHWENNSLSSVYNLTDLEECWFEKIHSKGFEGILSLLPVIVSTHLTIVANATPHIKPV